MRSIKKLAPALALFAPGIALACPGTLAVSGYGSDNVHLFDACDGSFQRLLDGAGRLDGPQGSEVGPDGLLYIVSEENGRIVRYDADTFAFVDVLAESQPSTPDAIELPVTRPTGFAVGSDGHIYVAGFDTNDLVRIDPTSRTVVREWNLGAAGLVGPDAGMAFHPDGRLLVPGFDSNNILAVDVDSNNISTFIPDNGILRNPRVVRVDGDGRILVASYSSNRIEAFDAAGNHTGQVLRTANPTGFVVRSDGSFLVTNDRLPQVAQFDASGALAGVLVANGSGGLMGSVFMTLVGAEGDGGSTPITLTTGEQLWLIGVGTFNGMTMTADMVVTSGTRFGDSFDPSTVVREVFGQASFEVTGCASGQFGWDSDDARFATGGYAMSRVAPNAAQTTCEADGVSTMTAQGTWFGGSARDGEGIMIDVLSETTAVVTWYTYLSE